MNFLKKQGPIFLLEAIATVLVIITVIMGVNGKALVLNSGFGIEIVIAAVIGILLLVAGMFVKLPFWSMLPAVSYFVAFGMIIVGAVPVIMDKINNITFQGGDFNAIIIYFILMGIANVLCIVATFLTPDVTVHAESKYGTVETTVKFN